MPVAKCTMPNKELAEGCRILYVPPNKTVVDRRGFGLVNFDLCNKEFGLHRHDVEAELQTICNRHLFATPVPDLKSTAWALFRKRMYWLGRQIGRVSAAPLKTLVEGRSGRRRSRFWLGIQRYWMNGIRKKDSRITEMQKLEMYETKVIPNKEDRGIQYRSVQYNVALAKHLHNIEERLMGMHPYGYRPVMKGATPLQRCIRLFKAAALFVRPVFLLLDHSRFDAHVHPELVKEEHALYLRCRRNHPELKKLLKMQLRNRGISKGGIKYETYGKRMSGDCNTSLGNTCLNMSMLYAWLDWCGVKGVVFLDGDDSVIIVEEEDYAKLKPVKEFMVQLGMNTELEVTRDIFKAEFCQSRPVILPQGPTFVRNPHKVMATIGRMAQSIDVKQAKAIVRASALCELAMAPGAPVIGPICRTLLNKLGDGRKIQTSSWEWKMAEQYKVQVPGKIVDIDPDDTARLTMYRAWGIDPGYQLVLESQEPTWNWGEGELRNKAQKETEQQVWEFGDLGQTVAKCDCGRCPTDVDEMQEFRYWGL